MDYRDPDELRALLLDANDRQIGHMLGVTDRTIRKWRHKFGIEPSPVPNRGSTKYSLNRAFFQTIDTPGKAYILGFIATDGCIHRNGKSLSIALMESDIDHLQTIRDALGGTNEIHVKTSSSGYQAGHRLAVLNLSSVELVRDLATLGIFPNKTFNLRFPVIPSHLESHLIRGLFDGDGHINSRHFYLVGTPDLLIGVQIAIQRHTGCLLSYRMANDTHARLTGYRRDRAALAWMYDNPPIALKRKHEKYRTFWC